jgi:hypothetical protein
MCFRPLFRQDLHDPGDETYFELTNALTDRNHACARNAFVEIDNQPTFRELHGLQKANLGITHELNDTRQIFGSILFVEHLTGFSAELSTGVLKDDPGATSEDFLHVSSAEVSEYAEYQ